MPPWYVSSCLRNLLWLQPCFLPYPCYASCVVLPCHATRVMPLCTPIVCHRYVPLSYTLVMHRVGALAMYLLFYALGCVFILASWYSHKMYLLWTSLSCTLIVYHRYAPLSCTELYVSCVVLEGKQAMIPLLRIFLFIIAYLPASQNHVTKCLLIRTWR